MKTLDEDMLKEVLPKYSKVITVEDGAIKGGFGSAVVEFMADEGYSAQIKRLGVPDKFIDHGTQQELWNLCKFDATAIVEAAKSFEKISI